MFSDRFRWIKAALALAAFAGLCVHADAEIARLEPPLETVSDSLRGRTVTGASKRVVASAPDWIEVSTSSGPLRVRGQTSPGARPGDTVTFFGEVVGPREVRPDRLRLNPGHAWKRPLNYVVSILTLLVWAAFAFGSWRRHA